MTEWSAQLAAAITAPDTDAALATATAVAPYVSLVEYRLDLIPGFDLGKLLQETPRPAIITCRPPHEGGRFAGSASERKAILAQAIECGADFIDVEEDILADLVALSRGRTRIIASHHDFQDMPEDWPDTGQRLREQGADIVKLVGFAHTSEDALPPIAWLHSLSAPGIGIAMGAEGIATRLLAPRLSQAFLSFAAAADGTAPGQISAESMVVDFGFHAIASAEPCFVALTPWPIPWPDILALRAAVHTAAGPNQTPWLLPIPAAALTPGLLQALQFARIAGIVRLPGVSVAPQLAAAGIDPDAIAWRLGSTIQSSHLDYRHANELAAFWVAP